MKAACHALRVRRMSAVSEVLAPQPDQTQPQPLKPGTAGSLTDNKSGRFAPGARHVAVILGSVLAPPFRKVLLQLARLFQLFVPGSATGIVSSE